MVLARLLLDLVADEGVHELLAARLLLGDPGGKKAGEKQQENDCTEHVENRMHGACT